MSLIITQSVLDKATELKQDVTATAEAAQEKAIDAVQAAEGKLVFPFINLRYVKMFLDKATELKQDVVSTAQETQEKAADAVHAVQGESLFFFC